MPQLFCQSAIQELFMDLKTSLLLWFDDIILHAATSEKLLLILEECFKTCRRYGLKLNAKKCRFFLRTVRWRGRIIDEEGIRLDPFRLKALLSVQKPERGNELQQCLCSANWMRSVIPTLKKLLDPLKELMAKIYELIGKRTKRAESKFRVMEAG